MVHDKLLRYLRAAWNRLEFRFLVVGAANTAVGYGVFLMLFLIFGTWIHYLLLSMVAHAIAVCIAYANQRHFVFRSCAPWLPEFVRFNISLLGALAFGMAALFVLVEAAALHVLIAQAIATPLTILATYLAHRCYSFNSPRDFDR